MGGFPSPVTAYEKSRRCDAVPDDLAPASSTPVRDTNYYQRRTVPPTANWRTQTLDTP